MYYYILLKYLSDCRKNATKNVDLSNFQKFGEVDKALADVGVTSETRMKIYKILAAILHLGNVSFEENSLVEGCQIADSTANHFCYAAQLLEVEQIHLKTSLLTRKMAINGSEPIV